MKVVNTSDADIAAAYKTPDVTAVVTWKPMVSTILESPDAKEVFDSSKIPGEIIDMMVVNTDVLKDNPKFGKALAGIWYETMAALEVEEGSQGAHGEGLRHRHRRLRRAARDDEAVRDSEGSRRLHRGRGHQSQERTCLRSSCSTKSLLGKDAKSDGAIGIEFPDKTVFGDKAQREAAL